MPRINLLPWRAELRTQRKKEFLIALAGTVERDQEFFLALRAQLGTPGQ